MNEDRDSALNRIADAMERQADALEEQTKHLDIIANNLGEIGTCIINDISKDIETLASHTTNVDMIVNCLTPLRNYFREKGEDEFNHPME
jgi:archaellum component FlaC